MGFFYKAGGGGGSNDAGLPASGFELNASSDQVSVEFTNAGSTPAPVELSFAEGFLKGVNPDAGTPQSPSYVIDPDSSPRTIYLERDGALSTNPDTDVVTFTGNGGIIGTQIYTITSSVAHVVRNFGITPTFEFKFEDLTNTGSVATGDYLIQADYTVQASSEQTGFTGYADLAAGSAANSAIYKSLGATATQAWNRSPSQDRSWIYCWSQPATMTGTYTYANSTAFGKSGIGWVQISGSTWQINDPTFTLDTSHSFSTGGASKATTTGASTLNVLVGVWDSTASTLTHYWKKTGDGTGYSSGSVSTSNQGTPSSNTHYLTGRTTSVANPLRTRYIAAVDYKMTAANFETLTTFLGL
jgi:hypothetical protein